LAHNECEELIVRISDERLRGLAMDAWTGKDVLAHLAWWQGHSARLIEDYRAGRQPDYTTHPGTTTDEINVYVYREHLGDSPEAARGAFAETFRLLLTAIEPLTDDDLSGADRCPWLNGGALAEMVFGDTSSHYDQHFAPLESLSRLPDVSA